MIYQLYTECACKSDKRIGQVWKRYYASKAWYLGPRNWTFSLGQEKWRTLTKRLLTPWACLKQSQMKRNSRATIKRKRLSKGTLIRRAIVIQLDVDKSKVRMKEDKILTTLHEMRPLLLNHEIQLKNNLSIHWLERESKSQNEWVRSNIKAVLNTRRSRKFINKVGINQILTGGCNPRGNNPEKKDHSSET